MINVTMNSYDNIAIVPGKGIKGTVTHYWHSPTHWSEVCTVTERYTPGKAVEVSFTVKGGGANPGYTPSQCALALSIALSQAALVMAGRTHNHATQEAA